MLEQEIKRDPKTKGYARMSDQQVADSLNAKTRSRTRTAMTGDEVFQQTVDFVKLDVGKRLEWLTFCARPTIDPRSPANVEFVNYIFDGGATVGRLASARNEPISRARELGLGIVRAGHVEEARK